MRLEGGTPKIYNRQRIGDPEVRKNFQKSITEGQNSIEKKGK